LLFEFKGDAHHQFYETGNFATLRSYGWLEEVDLEEALEV